MAVITLEIDMELKEYEVLAMRTAKVLDFKGAVMHGAMGCMTEAGEFAYTASIYFDNVEWNSANAIEELGDGLWFAVYTARAVGTSLAAIADRATFPMPKGSNSVLPHCGDLVAMTLNYCAASENIGTPIKAHVYYGKPLDQGLVRTALAIYYRRIAALAVICGFNMADVMHHNIAKLQKRYPDKYTDAAAIERADKAESSELHATATAMVGDTKLADNRLFDKAVQLVQASPAFLFPKSDIDVIT